MLNIARTAAVPTVVMMSVANVSLINDRKWWWRWPRYSPIFLSKLWSYEYLL